jgi:hypothetical protein
LQDKQARVVDVFLIFEEMNAGIIIDDRARKYNLTLQDLAQWTGLSIEEVSDEINKFVEKRRVDIFDGYIVVNNIMDIKRFVDQRSYWR